MKALYNFTDIISLAVKQESKPAVWVSNNLDHDDPKDEEIYKHVLSEIQNLYGKEQFFSEYFIGLVGSCLYFFETEEDQYAFYRIFETPLVDSSGFYAVTIDKFGNIETENT